MSRYWHLSVGFLKRSTVIWFSEIEVEVSKNARLSDGVQLQGLSSWLGVVWLTVYLIVG